MLKPACPLAGIELVTTRFAQSPSLRYNTASADKAAFQTIPGSPGHASPNLAPRVARSSSRTPDMQAP